jgi:hypothetical protein
MKRLYARAVRTIRQLLSKQSEALLDNIEAHLLVSHTGAS